MTPQDPHIAAMTPNELAAFEAAIISACAEHERDHRRESNYR